MFEACSILCERMEHTRWSCHGVAAEERQDGKETDVHRHWVLSNRLTQNMSKENCRAASGNRIRRYA